MCCKNCSSMATKCGYYLTFADGLVIFAVGMPDLFQGNIHFLIIGSLVILCCPLWIKDYSSCLIDLKNANDKVRGPIQWLVEKNRSYNFCTNFRLFYIENRFI